MAKTICNHVSGSTFPAMVDVVSIYPGLDLVEIPVIIHGINPTHPLLLGSENNAVRFDLKYTGGVYIGCEEVAGVENFFSVKPSEKSSIVESLLAISDTVLHISSSQCVLSNLHPVCIEETEGYETIKR
ncbi:hypothetical protein [Propionibacterium australiense]|nr:hypothetical protein [Propionibacterium australiense]